jgi:hypothetical protein
LRRSGILRVLFRRDLLLGRRGIFADELRAHSMWESCRDEATSKNKQQFWHERSNHGAAIPCRVRKHLHC